MWVFDVRTRGSNKKWIRETQPNTNEQNPVICRSSPNTNCTDIKEQRSAAEPNKLRHDGHVKHIWRWRMARILTWPGAATLLTVTQSCSFVECIWIFLVTTKPVYLNEVIFIFDILIWDSSSKQKENGPYLSEVVVFFFSLFFFYDQ